MKRFVHRIGIATALVSIALPALAGPVTESFSGAAYASDGNQLLYLETHYLFSGDHGGERVVLYECPDGRAIDRIFFRQRVRAGQQRVAVS